MKVIFLAEIKICNWTKDMLLRIIVSLEAFNLSSNIMLLLQTKGYFISISRTRTDVLSAAMLWKH